jgi:hypothetical protein
MCPDSSLATCREIVGRHKSFRTVLRSYWLSVVAFALLAWLSPSCEQPDGFPIMGWFPIVVWLLDIWCQNRRRFPHGIRHGFQAGTQRDHCVLTPNVIQLARHNCFGVGPHPFIRSQPLHAQHTHKTDRRPVLRLAGVVLRTSLGERQPRYAVRYSVQHRVYGSRPGLSVCWGGNNATGCSSCWLGRIVGYNLFLAQAFLITSAMQ